MIAFGSALSKSYWTLPLISIIGQIQWLETGYFYYALKQSYLFQVALQMKIDIIAGTPPPPPLIKGRVGPSEN